MGAYDPMIGVSDPNRLTGVSADGATYRSPGEALGKHAPQSGSGALEQRGSQDCREHAYEHQEPHEDRSPAISRTRFLAASRTIIHDSLGTRSPHGSQADQAWKPNRIA